MVCTLEWHLGIAIVALTMFYVLYMAAVQHMYQEMHATMGPTPEVHKV